MNTKIITTLFAGSAFFASSLFADDISTAITINTNADTSVTTTDLGATDIQTGGSYYLNHNRGNITYTFNLEDDFTVYSTANVTALKFDSRNAGAVLNANIKADIVKTGASGNTTLNFGQDDANGTLNVNLIGAQIRNDGGGELNFEIGRNAKTTLNIDSASLISATNINMSLRSVGSSAKINIDGGSIALTGYLHMSNIANSAYSGNGGMTTGVSVTNGGSLSVGSLIMQTTIGGADKAHVGTITVSGKNASGVYSSFTSSGAVTLGATSFGNSGDKGELVLHTGTSSQIAGVLTVNLTGSIRVVLDSDSIANHQTSANVLASLYDVTLYNGGDTTTFAGITKSIIIDGSLLAASGDDTSIALFYFGAAQGNVKLNGTGSDSRKVFGDLEAYLQEFIAFENNKNLQYWQDFDYGDLRFDNATQTIYLDLTAKPIPEPSTYAAIFGILALALAAYRRR